MALVRELIDYVKHPSVSTDPAFKAGVDYELCLRIARRHPIRRYDRLVAERAVARDRLPLVGAVPDLDAARSNLSRLSGAQLRDLPRRPGLYCATGFGSRGILWSVLAAKLLAAQLGEEPAALESDLIDAIDPGRFALRAIRQGTF